MANQHGRSIADHPLSRMMTAKKNEQLFTLSFADPDPGRPLRW
jgi:hypothetical protein